MSVEIQKILENTSFPTKWAIEVFNHSKSNLTVNPEKYCAWYYHGYFSMLQFFMIACFIGVLIYLLIIYAHYKGITFQELMTKIRTKTNINEENEQESNNGETHDDNTPKL